MRELQIPKRRVEVELTFTDGERCRLALFLSAQAPDRGGPERVSDLLARPEPFFPAADPATGDVTLVARDAVAVARLAPAEEPGGGDELTLPTEHPVDVHLRSGARVRGSLSYVLPPERSRPIDFLNSAPRFFRVLAGADLLLVNRDAVVRVSAA